MSKVFDRYCPVCDRIVRVVNPPEPDAASRVECPVCGLATAPLALNPIFPIGPMLALQCFRALARMLIKAGVMDHLEVLANKSQTPLDNFALALARTVLEVAADQQVPTDNAA